MKILCAQCFKKIFSALFFSGKFPHPIIRRSKLKIVFGSDEWVSAKSDSIIFEINIFFWCAVNSNAIKSNQFTLNCSRVPLGAISNLLGTWNYCHIFYVSRIAIFDAKCDKFIFIELPKIHFSFGRWQAWFRLFSHLRNAKKPNIHIDPIAMCILRNLSFNFARLLCAT